MSSDTVADFLTKIRNAQMAKHRTVTVINCKMNQNILTVLKAEGFVGDYQERELASGFPGIEIELKYFPDGLPVMKQIKRISKPGCRVYQGVKDIEKVQSGLGIAIVSTPQGVMSDAAARKNNVGGEVLAIVG